jgi:hypothetical protein
MSHKSHKMVPIHGHEAEVEEATEEDEGDVGVVVAEVNTVHIICLIMVEVSSTSRGVLWVLAVAPMEDIEVTVVVVLVVAVVVMGMEIIPVVMEIIGNMLMDMIVKMANGNQVRKSVIAGVKTVEVAADLLLRGALDTIITVIMSTSTDNTDHVDT